jgi:hypothetical protein
MANDPDVTALGSYSGAYEKKLMKRFLNKLAVENEAVAAYPGIKNKTTMTKIVVRKGAKPYTGIHKAKSDIVYTPRVIEVLDCQRDLTIEPKKYRNTYMGEMRGRGENSKNMVIPFAQFVNETVIDELAAEINNEAIYHGVGKAGFTAYAALTVYNPGDKIIYTQDGEVRYFECVTLTVAGQNPDTHPAKWMWAGAKALFVGFGKLLADEITAGTVVPVVTGATTSSNAYANFTAVWRDLPDEIKNSGGVILCSYNNYELLLDDYENKIKKNFEEVDGIVYLAKTNRKCVIVPWTAMSGSNRLIATAPKNFIVGTDDLSDMNTIKTIEAMYHLDMGITWVMGTQIRDVEAIAVNDQA